MPDTKGLPCGPTRRPIHTPRELRAGTRSRETRICDGPIGRIRWDFSVFSPQNATQMCYYISVEGRAQGLTGGEREMSKSFAEQIIDGMVDESGRCGERGMSSKQYGIITKHLKATEPEYIGSWEGDYGSVSFTHWHEYGFIGRYYVELEVTRHFNIRAVVDSITKWIEEVPTFEASEWQYQPRQREEMVLTLIRESRYERAKYSGYGYETVSVYTLADDNGNCYVWKTTSVLGMDVDNGNYIDFVCAKPGDRITMKATVKEHGEYRGIKQTVIVRPKVSAID